MVARMRPFNLGDLAGQQSAIEIGGRASENLSRTLLSGLLSVGEGIDAGKQRKESRRRFDSEQAMQREGLDLRRDEFLLRQYELDEKHRDRQASETLMLDSLDGVMDGLENGQPLTPEVQKGVEDIANSFPGGRQALLQKYERRGGLRGSGEG